MTLPIQHVVFCLKSAVTVAHTQHYSIKTQQVLSKHSISSPNSLPSRKCNNLTFTQNTVATNYQLITLASNDASVATTQIILATHKQPSRTIQRLENTAHPANNLATSKPPSKTQATTMNTIANTQNTSNWLAILQQPFRTFSQLPRKSFYTTPNQSSIITYVPSIHT